MLKTKVVLKFGSSIEKQFDTYKEFKDWLTDLEYHDNKVESYEVYDMNHITRPDEIEKLGNKTNELLLNRYTDNDWDNLNIIHELGTKLKYNC